MPQTSNTSNDYGYRDAYKAAIRGDLDTLQEFCSQHPMARINASGDTVFHILALNCHSNVFSKLLDLELPLHDLMIRNGDGDTALHEAARIGCLEIADLMLKKEANLISACNQLGETPIFVAAAFGQEKMLRFLSQKPDSKNGLRRNDGYTILHAAVKGQFYGLALVIMESFPDLALVRNDKGITALHLLARSPSSFRSGTFYSWPNLGSSSFIPLVILAIIVYSCIPMDVRVSIKADSENPQDGNGGIHPQSHNLPQNYWLGRVKHSYKKFLSCLPWLKEIVDVKQRHKNALELVKRLVARESEHYRLNYYVNLGEGPHNHCLASCPKWNKYEALSGKDSNIDPLLQATKCGIIEIVQVILEEFPDSIEVLDKTGKNILHLVAEYRQDTIFEFLKSKNASIMKKLVEVDKERNTPLHLSAKYGFYSERHVLPIVHQMPWELFWFKDIRKFSPPQTHHLQNDQGKTPKELFNETHKDLLLQSERRVKDNTGAAMLISILIATLMFTACLTVPGGFDPNSGFPIVQKDQNNLTAAYFLSVTLSLFFSLATLAISIRAYTSCFQQEDFYIFLPLEGLVCCSTLLASVILATMAYQVARLLESGGGKFEQYKPLGLVILYTSFVTATFIYIHILFPLYRFLIQVLRQSLSRQKWESID